MKRFKYQTLVTLAPAQDGGPRAELPGPTCRMVVRARHRETRATKMFSALVSTGEPLFSTDGVKPVIGDGTLTLTVIVLGDDAGDYLAPGERFVLWRGSDLGSGVVTRRIFV
jgi:hypothetical protein